MMPCETPGAPRVERFGHREAGRGPRWRFKSLLATTEAQRELLTGAGMWAKLLEDLGRLVGEFEVVAETARTGRRDHIGARVELEVVASELMELMRVLDGINRYRFGTEPELMAEWNAARDVPGAPRRVTKPEGEGEAPSGPGGIAPAA